MTPTHQRIEALLQTLVDGDEDVLRELHALTALAQLSAIEDLTVHVRRLADSLGRLEDQVGRLARVRPPVASDVATR